MRINAGQPGQGGKKCFSTFNLSCLCLCAGIPVFLFVLPAIPGPVMPAFLLPAAQLNGDCVGLTCDLNTRHTRKLTTLLQPASKCVYQQDKYKSSLLLFPFFSSALSLVFRHPPQGTLRAAPVPMTTSPLLSITKATSYSFALYMVPVSCAVTHSSTHTHTHARFVRAACIRV